MKIGIDLDGTLTDFNSYIISCGKKYGKKHFNNSKLINKNAYEISDIFNWNENEVKEFKEYIRTELRMKIKPRKNASRFLKFLHKNNFQIYIVTSRKESDLENCINNTKLWLSNNHLYYDKLLIGNSDKLSECKKNNIDIFIDDKIKHCQRCINNNIETYIFDNRYNQDSCIPRIYNFKQAINIFKKKVKKT